MDVPSTIYHAVRRQLFTASAPDPAKVRQRKMEDGKCSDWEDGENRSHSHDVEAGIQEVEEEYTADDEGCSDSEEYYSSESYSEDDQFDPAVFLNVLKVAVLDGCFKLCFEDADNLVLVPIKGSIGDYLEKSDRVTEAGMRTQSGTQSYTFTDDIRNAVRCPTTPKQLMQFAAAQGLEYRKFMIKKNRFLYHYASNASADVCLSSDATESSDYSDNESPEPDPVVIEYLNPEPDFGAGVGSPPTDSDEESGTGGSRSAQQKIQDRHIFKLTREDKLYGNYPLLDASSAAMDLRRIQYGSFYVCTDEQWFAYTVMRAICISEVVFLGALNDWFNLGEEDRMYMTTLPQYLDEWFPKFEEVTESEEEPVSQPTVRLAELLSETTPLGIEEEECVEPLAFHGRSTGRERKTRLVKGDIGLEATRQITKMISKEFDRHYKSILEVTTRMQDVCNQARVLITTTDVLYHPKKWPTNPRVSGDELCRLKDNLDELTHALNGWNDFILINPDEAEEEAKRNETVI